MKAEVPQAAAVATGTDGTKNSDEMKDLDNYAKKLLKYIDCLAKQWSSIFKTLKAAGDGEDNEKEEEEEESDDDD
jgi:hypothetical protein